MASNTKAIREQLGADAKRIREMADLINAENRDFTSEENEEWAKVNAAYDEKAKRLEKLERADAVTSRMSAVQDEAKGIIGVPSHVKVAGDGAAEVTAETWATALQGWMRYDSVLDVDEGHEAAAKSCGVRLSGRHFVIRLPQTSARSHAAWGTVGGGMLGFNQFRAALSSSDPGAGGVLIPTTFVNAFESAMVAFGGIRRVAEIMRTTTGEPMLWPHGSDTSNTGRLISESPTLTSEDPSPGFGGTALNAYGYTSDMIKVPYSLLQDSAVNLPQIIGEWLGERIGRITSTHFTTGDGAAKPYGIVTKATLGVTAASATSLDADELFDLQHSIDPAYRSVPGVGWAFHDNTLLAIRKFKTGDGAYHWQEGLSTGQPNLLLGSPYITIQEMAASIAASAKVILFGQLSKYKIRDVGEYRLKRLEERYAENDQVAFVALSRHDGNLLVARGSAPVKYLQMAA